MLRTCLTVLALLPVIGAPALSTDISPIEVTGRLSTIDSQVSSGFQDGPALFITVRNVSARGIRGYAYGTTFTDPASGERIEHRGHSTFLQPSLGVALRPGATEETAKPYPVRITATGVPADYSFDVDLVVFDDGTTWGPAKTRAGKELLSRIHGAPPKRR